MKIYKCGIPGCGEYIPEDEVKKVVFEHKVIDICTLCDDDMYEPVNGGEHYDTIKKAEKIRKHTRNQQN